MKFFQTWLCIAAGILCGVNACFSGDADPVASSSVASRQLEKYKRVLGPVVIDKVENNASDLVFSSKTKTLFLVLNKPTVVMELQLTGAVKRSIELKDFDDTEGITWVGDNMFGVVEERKRNLVLVPIDASTSVVDYAQCEKFPVDPEDGQNTGIEGVGYDSSEQSFLIVKEKTPKRIYKLKRDSAKPGGCEVTRPWDPEKDVMALKDLSGVYYDQGTKHWLLLSDESKCLVEVTLDGTEVSRLSLETGKSGLAESVPQPEGITMDEQGNIYICSEPNLFYVFSKENQ